jgi:acyl-coenzyme A thioesterase PaaI-like protein
MAIDWMGANPIRNAWDKLSPLPGGKLAFSKLLGTLAPYTGSVGAQFVEIRPGFGRCRLTDRRSVRNHLDSIHAIALCNFGEMTSGAALLYSAPDNTRTILTRIEIDYLKKARGTLEATCTFDVPATNAKTQFPLTVEIRNADGDLVSRLVAHWQLGPAK